MEFSANEILKLVERASGIPDFLSKKTDIEMLLGRFQSVEDYLARFGSLDELVTFYKRFEEKLYMLKTFLTTEEASKYVGVSVFTLREAVKRMELAVYTPPGKGYLFLRDDLDKWLGLFRNPSRAELEGAAGASGISATKPVTMHDRLSQKSL
ncbi:MAG: helix-turn-helix domain-containing protein [Bacteroidales bacterium]|nr:helix-turn-helix domain-containing protein [Bacteroidales bacterium]